MTEEIRKETKEAIEKKVDDAWKERIDNEKVSPVEAPHGIPEVTFGLFSTSLVMETLIALGDMEHPVTKKKESHLSHAKFMIDTLSMLQEKTKNNLLPEESQMLEGMLYDLRMRFIQKTKE